MAAVAVPFLQHLVSFAVSFPSILSFARVVIGSVRLFVSVSKSARARTLATVVAD